ncbi:MAG TPA: UDP-3-O-acyl-N-acetylglucosamine deacetylase [Armatimonadota bacterium]|nr:UDP-3-O-acyl-N-acetylglucosamine deacetylase [Armatimonadota bacterium]
MHPLPSRATLRAPVRLRDIGVRFGREVELTLAPAEIGAGLTIGRSDLGLAWPLNRDHCAAGQGCSISGEGEATVYFIEHVLAALAGCLISDCAVSLDGPEVPLFDGSTLPLVEAIADAGVARSSQPWPPVVVTEPILVPDAAAALCALPGEAELTYALAYDHPMIGRELASFRPGTDDFATELAPARTFIMVQEAEAARAAGLLAAGSEENSVVVYPDHLSEEPALPQAFARHKLVDMIGDLFVLGRPVLGRVLGFYTGHRHNHELARRLAGGIEPAD